MALNKMFLSKNFNYCNFGFCAPIKVQNFPFLKIGNYSNCNINLTIKFTTKKMTVKFFLYNFNMILMFHLKEGEIKTYSIVPAVTVWRLCCERVPWPSFQ